MVLQRTRAGLQGEPASLISVRCTPIDLVDSKGAVEGLSPLSCRAAKKVMGYGASHESAMAKRHRNSVLAQAMKSSDFQQGKRCSQRMADDVLPSEAVFRDTTQKAPKTKSLKEVVVQPPGCLCDDVLHDSF